MTMGNWEEVVDLQDEAIRFWMSQEGASCGRNFGASMLNSIMNDPDVSERAKEAGFKVEDAYSDTQWLMQMAQLEARKLMMAEPIFVNDEVHAMIEHAAQTWKPESLHVEDIFPTLYGFMVFPKPFYVKDFRGKRLAFRALSWAPLDKVTNQLPRTQRGIAPQDAGGLLLTAYSHKADEDDYPLTPEMAGFTRLPSLSLCHVAPWHFGQAAPIDVNGSGLDQMLVISQVAWRLARQTITTPESQQLPRAFRKRAVKADLSSDVTVIRLRHVTPRKPQNGDVPEIDWQFRWIVRAHWHTYHTKQGPKQVYISDYLKGPEDKPLRVKTLRAFELVR